MAMSRWQKSAVPPGVDSTRIYYLDPKTGEMCYRVEAWTADGQFRPHDGTPGIGVDFYGKTGPPIETGKTYPAKEFE